MLVGLSLIGCAGPKAAEQAKEPDRVRKTDIISSVDFNFVDKRTFKDKSLLKIMGFKRGDPIDPVLARIGAEHLQEFYLKKGFPFNNVELDEKKVSEKEAIYTYNITEGPRVKIKSVKFVGNRNVKTRVLKGAAKSSKKKWFILAKDYYEETVAEDVRRLQDKYWERGFLNYTITAKKEFSKNRRKVRIIFEIIEGPAYTVDKIVFSGTDKLYALGIDETLSEQALKKRLKLKEGETYIDPKAQADAKWLRQIYGQHGFVDAEVQLLKPEFIPGTTACNIRFDITEGQQFRIGRIDITGNKQTQDKVVRRILDSYDFLPGKIYNSDVAPKRGGGQLEQDIQRTILAQEVTITPVGGVEPGQKNVEVNIKEGQTGMVMLGAGVGSDSGLMGQLVLEQKNFDINDWPESFREFITGQAFKGAGQQLRISLQPGTEISQHSVSFTEPYFKDKPVWFSLRGSSWERERESYEEGRLKGSAGFGQRYQWRYRDDWRKSIDFRLENVDVDDLDFDAPQEIRDVKGKNFLAGVKLGARKDLTDNRFRPTEGYILDAGYEQLSGDFTFGVLSGTYTTYRTLYEDLAGRRTILATKLYGATVLGTAPSFEKFYAGGMGALYGIRGFEYRGVSPRGTPVVDGVPVVDAKKKDPIGSDWIFLAGSELIVPVVKESLSALFFVDSGTVESGSYRASAGTGIELLIPQWFGPVPMRFGVAAPFLKDDQDDTEAFFFSVGRLF
jgi:outer membrane protein insertion porin family